MWICSLRWYGSFGTMGVSKITPITRSTLGATELRKRSSEKRLANNPFTETRLFRDSCCVNNVRVGCQNLATNRI